MPSNCVNVIHNLIIRVKVNFETVFSASGKKGNFYSPKMTASSSTFSDYDSIPSTTTPSSKADAHWFFTKEQLEQSPSRKAGFDADKELFYRQQTASFIQEMGSKLQL